MAHKLESSWGWAFSLFWLGLLTSFLSWLALFGLISLFSLLIWAPELEKLITGNLKLDFHEYDVWGLLFEALVLILDS